MTLRELIELTINVDLEYEVCFMDQEVGQVSVLSVEIDDKSKSIILD